MNAFWITLLGLAAIIVFAAGVSALFTAWTARKVEAALPPKGRWIDVEGSRLHVREAGPDEPAARTAPAIVMIHGLAGQSSHYTYGVMPRLAERFHLVALDRPGAGYSPRADGAPADLATQAAAIARLIDKLGLGRPLVVGHSLGGAVALALALDHPDKVCGLALLAPVTHMPQDGEPPAVFKGLTIESPLERKLVAWTLAIPVSIKNSARTLEAIFGPEAVPKDFATKGGGLLSLRPRAFLGASADLQALPDSLPRQQERYADLRVPVHVLYGKDDRILDWKHNGQGLVDKVPGARLQLTEGGHMLPITQPELCAEFIEAAAKSCAASANDAAHLAAR
jgi:pimeloyl-ACP methyl ester carboxylesterase